MLAQFPITWIRIHFGQQVCINHGQFYSDTGYRAVPELPDGVDDYGEEFNHLPVCPAFKQIGEHRGPFDLGLVC